MCIRCGADVSRPDGQNLFQTIDGGVTCPSSLPGEASVHRITAPVRHNAQYQQPVQQPQQGSGLLGAVMSIFKAVAVFKGAEYVARGDWAPRQPYAGPPPNYPDPSDHSRAADILRWSAMNDYNKRR